MMWLPSCPWPCFMSETNVLLIAFSEIGEDVDSLAFGFFSEILIANGAFWINLSHQLRAEISQIFSNIFHSSPATYFILVGSYWKKGGSAPKKGGSGPHGPPPPADSFLTRYRETGNVKISCQEWSYQKDNTANWQHNLGNDCYPLPAADGPQTRCTNMTMPGHIPLVSSQIISSKIIWTCLSGQCVSWT